MQLETGFQSNDQIAEAENQERTAQAQQRQANEVITSLASYVQRCWESAKKAKNDVETAMLKVKRRIKGDYEPDVLQKIEAQGGSSIFMRLDDEKSEAAKAWFTDLLIGEEDPFSAQKSPVPTLPPQQTQMIAEEVRAETEMAIQMGAAGVTPADIDQRIKMVSAHIQKKMQEKANEVEAAVETKIKDVIAESGWKDALDDFISDFVDYKAGFLKGPLVRQKKVMDWDQQGEPVPTTKLSMAWEAPSPFDIYPFPASRTVNDGLIEKHTLRVRDIEALRGVKGYDDAAIELVLQEYGSGGLRKWIYETNQNTLDTLSYRKNVEEDPEGTIDALQLWGKIQGLSLVEHGVSPDRLPDLFTSYDAEIWLIGNYVIKCELNGNPLGEVPYYKVSFREKKGQFWGDGLPDTIEDCSRMCNAAARNVVNNIGMASGVQIGVDTDAMPPGEKITTLEPNKIWQFQMKDIQNGTRAPMWFFQPKSMVTDLIAVWDKFSEEADNKSGIPKYTYGQGGASINNATQFSMMMSNASRGVKKSVRNIDTKVISKSIKATHTHLLLYDPDPILRMGDVNLQAIGSRSLIQKEQAQVRRQEALQVLLHPAILEIIGREGLSEFLRQFFRGLDSSTADIVPSKEDVLLQTLISQMQPVAGQPQVTKGTETNQAGGKQGGADARTFN